MYRPPVKVIDKRGITFLVHKCTGAYARHKYVVSPVIRRTDGNYCELSGVPNADYMAGYVDTMGEVTAYVKRFAAAHGPVKAVV